MNPNQTHGNMPGDSVPGPSSASDMPDMAMLMGAAGQLMQQSSPQQKEQSNSQREVSQPPTFEEVMDTNLGRPPHPRHEQQMPHLTYQSIPHPSDQPRMQVTKMVLPHQVIYPTQHTLCPPQQVVPPILQQFPQEISAVQHQQSEQLHQSHAHHCQCDIHRNGPLNSQQMANPINEPINLTYPKQSTTERMNFPNSEPILQQQLAQPIPQHSDQYVPQHHTSVAHQEISSQIGQLNPAQVAQPGPSRAPIPQIQDQMDNISRIRSLFPSLRDAVSNTFLDAAHSLLQNTLEDLNSPVLPGDVSQRFNIDINDIFGICDHIELFLKTAASSAELAQSVARYRPQDTSDPTNTDQRTDYLRFLVSIRVQIAYVNEIHDILVAAAQNQPPVQEGPALQ